MSSVYADMLHMQFYTLHTLMYVTHVASIELEDV